MEIQRVQIDPNGKKEKSKYESLKEMKTTLEGYIDQAKGAFYVGCEETGLQKSETERALRNTTRANIENASDEVTKEFYNAVRNPISKAADFYEGNEGLSNFKEMLLNLKDLMDQVIECENQLHTINETLRDFEISITSEIFSERFINTRLAEVDELENTIKRKLANNEYPTIEATVAARKDLAQCDHLRKTYDLTFILDDIDYDKLIDTFMRRMSNDYCFKKAVNVLDKMKLSMASLNSFANLEETYFNKKYKIFNNFFLFHIIRIISHMDPSNKLDCLRAKTLIHGLVGYVSAPDKCTYIESLIDRFYEPVIKRLEEDDPNVKRLAEVNPYTTDKSADTDKEILDKVIDNDKEKAISYIKHMMLRSEKAVSNEATVDNWINNATDEAIYEMREKISMLVALGEFDPESFSILVMSAIDYNGVKEKYDKMNKVYDETIKK
nr:MAG TPA: hypothetical protein [Caudoviricetes sp.]